MTLPLPVRQSATARSQEGTLGRDNISADSFHPPAGLNHLRYIAELFSHQGGKVLVVGEYGCPYTTPAEAIALAVSGDVVLITPGTYDCSASGVTSISPKAGVPVIGVNRDTCIIGCGNADASVIFNTATATDVYSFANLTFQSTATSSWAPLVTSLGNAGTVYFDNCVFEPKGTGNAFTMNAADAATVWLRDCIFKVNTARTPLVLKGGTVYVERCSATITGAPTAAFKFITVGDPTAGTTTVYVRDCFLTGTGGDEVAFTALTGATTAKVVVSQGNYAQLTAGGSEANVLAKLGHLSPQFQTQLVV